MSLWKVAWRSIQQRALVSALTVTSMGLGVALVVAVLVVYGVVSQSFHRGGEGYDLIVGAKGGREQLVLNTVFYLSQPVGNIPYDFYEELTIGKYASEVEAAVPVCMGHTYQGFRVVGTTPDMFNTLKYGNNKDYLFAQGENFKNENRFDGVFGATAAANIRLQLGETFLVVHGGEGGHAHKQPFRLVGILAPTGTPVDNAVFVNMLGFSDIHHAENLKTSEKKDKTAAADKHDVHEGHDHDAHEKHDSHETHAENHAHEDHAHEGEPTEITAALVCIRPDRPGMADIIARLINNSPTAQAVAPARVISDLFESVVGKLQWILLGMAVLTVIEAGIGIMVSIYNSMSDRRHEIAVMRALGASRRTVMMVILMESILLALLGGGMGLLIGHGAIWACSGLITEWTGVVVGLLQFQWVELILVPGLIALAAAVGYLPAMAAYRTDVAKSLITTP